MKTTIKTLITLLGIAMTMSLVAQVNVDEYEFDGANCTSIMVGKKASADGSVMTSHTCDSWYRTWMRWEPAADHEDNATAKVYKGTMHTMSPSETKGLEVAAEIPLHIRLPQHGISKLQRETARHRRDHILRSRHLGKQQRRIPD